MSISNHVARFGYPFPPMAGGAEQGGGGSGEGGSQGGEAAPQGNALHESFVSNAPEHLRDAARELVPHWDRYVQRQFTDHADFRKGWEPYEQLGLQQYDPNEIQSLLEFGQIVNDEQQFRSWFEKVGGMLGYNLSGEDEFEAELGLEEGGIPRELRQFMENTQAWMQQYEQRDQATQAQQQQQQELETIAQETRQHLDSLKEKDSSLTEDDEDFICTLALKYDSSDAIQRGYEDYQKIKGNTERNVFHNHTDPALRVAPVSGGSTKQNNEPITTFEQAAQAARERLRNS